MTIIETIGMVSIAAVVAAGTFYVLLFIMDRLRWWSAAGLGAFIPMFAVAVPVSIIAAGLVVWGITP